MTVSLALGVGFRKACSSDAIVALARRALDQVALRHASALGGKIVLATIAEKDRPALREAAATLGFEVRVLPKAALAGTEDRTTIVSARAKACLGVPSVAEAAALAAAGPGATLIVARIAGPDATCAVARACKFAP